MFFDVETTVPIRPGQGYAILEFGAILVCPKKLVELESYSTLVRPADLSLITSLSVRCNGITKADVVSAPTFSEIADRVYDILQGMPPSFSFYGYIICRYGVYVFEFSGVLRLGFDLIYVCVCFLGFLGFRDSSFDWVFWVEILRTYILGVRFWVFWVLAGCLGWKLQSKAQQ